MAGERLGVNTERLAGSAPAFKTLASRVGTIHTTLESTLAGLGACWGDDETGKGFSDEYVPQAKDAQTAVKEFAEVLSSAGDGVSTLAKGTVRTEQQAIELARSGMSELSDIDSKLASVDAGKDSSTTTTKSGLHGPVHTTTTTTGTGTTGTGTGTTIPRSESRPTVPGEPAWVGSEEFVPQIRREFRAPVLLPEPLDGAVQIESRTPAATGDDAVEPEPMDERTRMRLILGGQL